MASYFHTFLFIIDAIRHFFLLHACLRLRSVVPFHVAQLKSVPNNHKHRIIARSYIVVNEITQRANLT